MASASTQPVALSAEQAKGENILVTGWAACQRRVRAEVTERDVLASPGNRAQDAIFFLPLRGFPLEQGIRSRVYRVTAASVHQLSALFPALSAGLAGYAPVPNLGCLTPRVASAVQWFWLR